MVRFSMLWVIRNGVWSYGCVTGKPESGSQKQEGGEA